MRKILPFIIASITNHPRQQVKVGVDFQWEPKLWVHNIFRIYELIFWRRAGIRAEMSAWTQEGTTYYQCHSWESVFALTEANIRGALKWHLPMRVYMPIFAPAGTGVLMSPSYLFAIAVDTQVAGSLQSSITATTPYTVSGSNTLLVAHNVSLNAGAIVGSTYNAVAMTSVTGLPTQLNSDTSQMAQYVIVGVSGTANIVLTTGSGNKIQIGTSYTGVNQSVTPDSVNNLSTVTSAPVTATNTVVASGCWLFNTVYSGGSATTAGTGAFLRQQGSNVTIAAFDSNGTVGTGSQSMTITTGGSTTIAWIQTSFKPSGGATVILPFKTLLGVGK